MGSDISGHSSFTPSEWKVVESSPLCKVLQHCHPPHHRMEEYTVHSGSNEDYQKHAKMFEHRRGHPQLVAGYYLKEENGESFCATKHQHRLFIEEIPIRLSDIEDVPFPDNLHLYSQCLGGLRELASSVGCFEVMEECIGVNAQGVVKVWMN